MLTLHRKVPGFIRFFFMKCEPTRHNFQLFSWQRARQEFPVDRYCLILTIVNTDMRFVVLPNITKQHIDYHPTEAA